MSKEDWDKTLTEPYGLCGGAFRFLQPHLRELLRLVEHVVARGEIQLEFFSEDGVAATKMSDCRRIVSMEGKIQLFVNSCWGYLGDISPGPGEELRAVHHGLQRMVRLLSKEYQRYSTATGIEIDSTNAEAGQEPATARPGEDHISPETSRPERNKRVHLPPEDQCFNST